MEQDKKMNDEAKKCILIVDDNPESIFILNFILKADYIIKGAPNGKTALKIVQMMQPPVDMILLDIKMPEMDGFEVCRQLKADPSSAHIPILFVSGKDDLAEREQGIDLGAVDFLTKPVDLKKVRELVAEHIGKSP